MLKFIRKSFIAKAGMATAALAFLVVLSAGFISYMVTSKQLMQMLQNEMDNKSAIIAGHLKNELKNIVENISDTSKNTLFANALADSGGRDNYLMPFLNSFTKIGTVKVSVLLTDFEGTLLAENPVKIEIKPESELLKQTVDLGKAQVQLNYINQDIYITLLYPVLYANTGFPEGSLVYQFKLSELTKDVFGRDKVNFLVNFSQKGEKGFSLIHGENPDISSVFRSKDVSLPSIFSSRLLTIRVWEYGRQFSGQLNTLAYKYIVLCVLGMLLIILISLTGSRWLLARLKALEIIAIKVVESKSLDQRFPQKGYDEISKIGQAFNHMLEALNQAYEELKSETNREMKQQAERFQRVLSATLEGYVRIDINSLIVEEVNEAFCRMTDHECKIWRGSPVPDFLLPIVKNAESASNPISWTEEACIKTQENTSLDMLFHCNLDIDRDNNRQLVIFLTDISERKAAEAKLKSVNEQLIQSVEGLELRDRELTLLNRMNDLLLASRNTKEAYEVVRLTASKLFPDASGALSILNPEKQVLETEITWGKQGCISDRFHIEECWAMRQGRIHQVTGNDDEIFCSHLEKEIIKGSTCIPLVVKGKTMGLLWLELLYHEESYIERTNKISISLGDAIKLALSNLELREALHEQATRDPLTKLYNRRFFSEVINHELSRVKRNNSPLSISIIDLDHFKSVNDVYGHDAGDQVLIELANILNKRLRGSDSAFRFGGEEFVILFPETDYKGAMECLEDIRNTLENTQISHNGTNLRTITMSGGLAQYPAHGKDEQALLKAADDALYKAKEAGRNNIQTAE